ncbi:MAG: hypothetical protein ACRYFU_11840 [Janthinobacterium lividum]
MGPSFRAFVKPASPGMLRRSAVFGLCLGLCGLVRAGWAQNHRPLDPPVASQPETPHHRSRLILKDGTYQTVMSYTIQGGVVRYRSAERGGETEDLPLELVDLPATKAWEQAHDPAVAGQPAAQGTVLSPELAHEEARRQARTPEVVKDLRLPEEDSVLVFDTFHGVPELVPLPQQNSDLNRETAHNTVKKDIDPAASPHDMLLLKEDRADVQLHIADPVFFVRLEGKGGDEADGGGAGFTVDTGGASGRATPGGGSATSRYVLERVDVLRDQRAVSSFLIRNLGTGHWQPDLIELRAEILPGGLWERFSPAQPLEFGEYALIEVLNDRAVNAGVWDFGVHPTAKENDEAMRPEVKRPAQLERRP